MAEPLHYLTIAEAARLIAARELSPVELTRAHLERIDALDGGLKAYVTVSADAALAEARAAEREIADGALRGPLHGVPLAYKDLFDTAGVRTTAGSKLWADRVPGADATVVARLREAGAVMLGKLALSEFAAGAVKTYVSPASVNPWAPDRFTGASSSGSGVAVAAGLAMGALGSDTGGSIRGPAVCCGIFGLKPTYGLLSRYGAAALSWTLDHAGPMTRTAEDAALMLAAMAGRDPADATTIDPPDGDYPALIGEPIAGLRVGLLRGLYREAADGAVADAVDGAAQTLASLGAEVVEVELPTFRQSFLANAAIIMAEALAYHRDTLRDRFDDYGAQLRDNLLLGAMTTGRDYVQALRVRAKFMGEFAELTERVDVVMSPVFNEPAPLLPSEDDPVTWIAKMLNDLGPTTIDWTSPYNLLGAPAASVPCGFTPEGVPLGFQLAARRLDDATVLRAAHAYQQATDWHARRPMA